MEKDDNYYLNNIEKQRTKVLDLTARNDFINFKETQNDIIFIDEIPDFIFNQFLDNKSFTIKDIDLPNHKNFPEFIKKYNVTENQLELFNKKEFIKLSKEIDYNNWINFLDINKSKELKNEAVSKNDIEKKKHKDSFLQTSFFPKELEAILYKLDKNYNSFLKEKGVNNLYISFFNLEWYDSDSSKDKNNSPVLLLPVKLKKDSSKLTPTYCINWTGEDIFVNKALEVKLYNDFKIVMPEFTEDDTPYSYCLKFKSIFDKYPNWRTKYTMYLSIFNSNNIAIYNDLNQNEWLKQKQSLLNNQLIKKIFNPNLVIDRSIVEDFKIYEIEDLEKKYPIILNADSTQYKAIVKASKGESFVIEGPPGTGKSQTITNIIANLLSQNKKVLFLAEKQAALSVVKTKMEENGLGSLCLELHSDKANKKIMLANIEERKKEHELYKNQKSKVNSKDYNSFNLLFKSMQFLNSYQKEISIERIHGLTAQELTSKYVLSYHKIKDIRNSLQNIELFKTNKDIENIDKFINEYKNFINLVDKMNDNSSLSNIKLHPWYSLEVPFSINIENQIKNDLENINLVIDNNLIDINRIEESIDYNLKVLNIDNLLKNSSILHSFIQLFQSYNIETINNLLMEKQEIIKNIAFVENIFDLSNVDNSLIQEYFNLVNKLILNHKLFKYEPLDKLIKYSNTIINSYSISYLLKELEKITKFSDNPTVFLDEKYLADLIFNVKYLFLIQSQYKRYINHFKNIKFSSIDNSQLEIQLRNIKNSIGDIQKNISNLSHFFDIDIHNYENYNELNKKLDKYKNASIFYKMSKEYKNIHQEFISMIKDDSIKKRNDIIELIDKKTSLLKKIDDFNQNKEYKNNFQHLFNGLDSDLIIIEQFINYTNECFKYLNINFIDISENNIIYLSELFEDIDSEYVTFITLNKINNMKNIDNHIKLYEEEYHVFKHFKNKIKNSRINIKESFEKLSQYSNFKSFESELDILNNISPVQVKEILTLIEFLNNEPLGQHIINKNFLFEFSKLSTIEESLTNLYSLIDKFNMNYKNNFDIIKINNLFDLNNFIKQKIKKTYLVTDYINQYLPSKNELIKQKYSNDSIVDLIEKGLINKTNYIYVINFLAYDKHIKELFVENEIFNEFRKSKYESNVSDLDESTNNILEYNKQLILINNSKNDLPKGKNGNYVSEKTELFLLNHVISKPNSHTSIRDIISKTKDCLLELKPCFMMSPLSVSNYLKREQYFDVLIIDEASQMFPHNAIGAISRCKQVIVVGDSKQLNPSNFFNVKTQHSQDEEYEDDSTDEISILDIASNVFNNKTSLQWHYRSKNDKLIGFSNKSYYNSDLFVFPSAKNTKTGIKFEYIPNGYFKDGKNNNEALELVNKFIEFIKEHPNQSFGIVAMNSKQAEFIERLIEDKKATDPVFRNIVNEKEYSESLFIKNIENVQGDERDYIFISFCYGKMEGTENVPQRFGLVNRENGWRYLNVLFTRARYGMHIFSSIKYSDVLKSEDKKRGVTDLYNFLYEAQYGSSETKQSNRLPDSDFEICVMEMLKERGYDCIPQVGCQGFFIDIGVLNPDPLQKEDFILAIECDGASYHSSKSARDRDVLRQNILESLGWKIHRIWSKDWFQSPENEIQKIIDLINSILKK